MAGVVLGSKRFIDRDFPNVTMHSDLVSRGQWPNALAT